MASFRAGLVKKHETHLGFCTLLVWFDLSCSLEPLEAERYDVYGNTIRAYILDLEFVGFAFSLGVSHNCYVYSSMAAFGT